MRKELIIAILLLYTCTAHAQQSTGLADSLQNIPSKYYRDVEKKLNSVSDRLTKKSLKYLAKFQKQEEKLQARLARLNPQGAVTPVSDAAAKYKSLTESIKSKTSLAGGVVSGAYNPNLDSLGTSLSFLKQFDGITDKVKDPLKNFGELQGKLQQAGNIQAFIAERKNQIQQLLSKYTSLPTGLKNEYTKLTKTAYYYSAQVQEYKAMLKDPDKMERKAMSILRQVPAFQKFWQKNSQMAQLFPLPDNPGSMQGLAGLQTSASVQQLIQQRISSGGPNAMAIVRQNMAAGEAELNKIKDKLNSVTGGSSSLPMPDFKANDQKTKTLKQRIEYEADMQVDKSNKLLPSGANMGLGIGYKLNDKSTAGIGLSYKLGMGTIQHISFTSQAIGLRSFVDWKIKKQIYVTGGYEMNYNTAFKNIEQLKNYNAWQRIALIGLSKKYSISKKVKGEMKVLYDFLANTHIPVSQPILFRLGYTF